MASGWYCKATGQVMGPMALEKVVQLAADGTLQPDDMVRRKTGEWVVASAVRGLFTSPAAAPIDAPEVPGAAQAQV